ncbi:MULTISPECIES: DUF3551 domain-containing protein [unclassified Bradyrhizobium]
MYVLRPAWQDAHCLQRPYLGYPGNCQFSSFCQCMATASGTEVLRYRPDLRISAAGRTIALTTSTRCHEKAHNGNAGCCYEKSCLRRIVVVFERVQQKLPTPQWRPPLDCDRTTAP